MQINYRLFTKYRIFLLISIFIIVFSWTGQADASQVYQVKAGDSLWALSKKWDVSVDEIKVLNNLDTDRIVLGQILVIPQGFLENNESANPEGLPAQVNSNNTTLLYMAKEGDSLRSLAKQWGVSVEDIKAINKLYIDNIIAEQILIMPKNASKNSVNNKQIFRDKKEDRNYEDMANRGGYRSVTGLAQGLLGAPYVGGSTNPAIGFDCSGLTQYVYSLVGTRLPRTSYDQYNIGFPVDRSMLVSGDLVFFCTGSRGVNHVGIYLGEEKFISATLSRGVAIDSLSSSYWNPRYLGARRIIYNNGDR